MKNFLHSRGVYFTLAFGAVLMFGLLYLMHSFMYYTNTTKFCISCHEMEMTTYQEYKQSLHYKNRTGVRAECPDCHVPRTQPETLYAKIAAYKDVYHHLIGTIDTKEKFEKNRLRMAKIVWKKMEESDSRECKTCHNFDAMIIEEQGRRGRKKHPKAIEEGKTCINCHKGVVHNLPLDYEEEE